MDSGDAQQAQSTVPWLRWVLIGCGGAIALLVVLVVVLVLFVRHATAGPEQVVKAFLAAAAAGEVEEAHGYFSAPLKEAQSLEAFRAGIEANPSLFDVADTTFSERSVDLKGAKLAGTLSLRSGTEVPASFRLVREHDAWKLIAYQIGDDTD